MNIDIPPNPGITATDILSSLPLKLGEERSQALVDWFAKGAVPNFNRVFQEVSWFIGLDPQVHVTFYCLPDFLCLGTDEDWVYCPMGALTAERVLEPMGACLPTPLMVGKVYWNNECNKQVAKPWGPPYDDSMKSSSRWKVHTNKVKAAPNFEQGTLMEGHQKNVCVSRAMEVKKGEWLSFYGWFAANNKAIQGNNLDAHGAEYCDYSHGVRAVLNQVVINDNTMTLVEALTSSTYSKHFSDEVMKFGTYTATRAHYGITQIRY